MAITFPREIPPVGFVECDLRLEMFVSQSRSGGRLLNHVEYADPAWVTDMRTRPIPRLEFLAFEAWWDSLRGGLKSVLFRHPAYVCPLAHRDAPGPEAQAGLVQSLTSGNVVSVSGVNAGLILSPGDFVSFAFGALRALGRVTDATGDGTSARTITIEPPPPSSVVQAGATVSFDRAELIMRPVAGSFEKDGSLLFQSASFQLIESPS